MKKYYKFEDMQRIVTLDHEAREAYAKDPTIRLQALHNTGVYMNLNSIFEGLDLNEIGTSFYRVAPAPWWRPFRHTEHAQFIGRSVKRRDGSEHVSLITDCKYLGVRLGSSIDVVTYMELFNDYVFTDGTPCGVEVEE